jgi:hypothetical protein
MKYFLLLSLAVVSMLSCSKETQRQPTAEECLSCAWLPACTGIESTYQLDQIDSFALNIVDVWKVEFLLKEEDSTINGMVCKKLKRKYSWINPRTDITESSVFYHCDNGTSIFFEYGLGTGTLKPVMTLKANAAISSSWSDTYIEDNGVKTQLIYTMREKGISHTAYGNQYKDVIHVSYIYKQNDALAFTGDYFFAKNVGLIEDAYTNGSDGINRVHTELRSVVAH